MDSVEYPYICDLCGEGMYEGEVYAYPDLSVDDIPEILYGIYLYDWIDDHEPDEVPPSFAAFMDDDFLRPGLMGELLRESMNEASAMSIWVLYRTIIPPTSQIRSG